MLYTVTQPHKNSRQKTEKTLNQSVNNIFAKFWTF